MVEVGSLSISFSLVFYVSLTTILVTSEDSKIYSVNSISRSAIKGVLDDRLLKVLIGLAKALLTCFIVPCEHVELSTLHPHHHFVLPFFDRLFPE